MQLSGNLAKMKTTLKDKVEYQLSLGDNQIQMNQFLGYKIKLEFTGEINCQSCGIKTNKSFAQGFCYNCMTTAPEASECILHPEKCQAHQGIARDMKWAETHCLQPHYVYLALTSKVKVGVTRATQIPTRWIDQGAWKAIRIAKTPNRNLAGRIEVELKNHFSDKTNYQSMLKNIRAEEIDLITEMQKIKNLLPDDLKEYVIENDAILEIEYPVLQTPEKITSLSFDKEPTIEGTLLGIRAQYLFFDNNRVLNIRKHTGYKINFKI